MLWITIIGMGIITYAIRLSLMGLWDGLALPAILQQALKFVPIAVLSAIILPELVQPGGTLDISWGNGRLIAGTLAIIIAWWSKSALWPIAIGMITVWILTWI